MKTNKDLILKDKPTLEDFHNYVKNMEAIRGFDEELVLQKCLMLGEEVGELFKAIRKDQKIKIDATNSKFGDISDELADVFIYILSIANKYNIDLEQAFRKKEEINKNRNWS